MHRPLEIYIVMVVYLPLPFEIALSGFTRWVQRGKRLGTLHGSLASFRYCVK